MEQKPRNTVVESIKGRRIGKLAVSYMRVQTATGVTVHGFQIQLGNRSWSVELVRPAFIYCGNVSRNLRIESEKSADFARIAGLDFPSHGFEQE